MIDLVIHISVVFIFILWGIAYFRLYVSKTKKNHLFLLRGSFVCQATVLILLVISIWIFRLPDIKNSNTTPQIIIPGDYVKLRLTETEIRTLHAKLYTDSLAVFAFPVRLENNTSYDWTPQYYDTYKDVWSTQVDLLPFQRFLIPSVDYWIKFTLNDESSLGGRKLELKVHAKIRKPTVGQTVFIPGKGKVTEVRDVSFSIDKLASFYVATPEQKRIYNRFWIFKIISFVLAMIMNSLGIYSWKIKKGNESVKRGLELFDEGTQLYEQKNFSLAQERLTDALKYIPENEECVYNLALVYFEQKDYKTSLALVEKISQLDCSELINELRKKSV